MIAAHTQPKISRLGPYQLLAKIGEGGMGTVHLAKMEGPAGFNKLAVVKELRADLTGSSEFREMFSNEVRLAARLTHPNVVHTYGANEDAGRLYLAMEYLDGQPWSRIRNALWNLGSLPNGLHLKVLAEALAGLHYAHELRDYDGTPLQVVHCDMSPQNIFVTYDGLVKLVDFGVARAVIGKATPMPDLIMGKLAYVAPEQARGDEVDRRADVFSVGVMLWEAMTGRRFLQQKDGSEARRRRISGIEPRVRTIAPDSPPALAEICDRALALDPNERFATAAEFRDALLGFLGEEIADADRLKLGELVSGAFEKERARLHAVIEQHMRPAGSPSGSFEHLVISLHREEPVEPTQRADMTELASVSRRVDAGSMVDALHSVSIRALRRKSALPIVVAAVAALSFMLTWFLARPDPHETTSHRQPQSRPLAARAAEADQTRRDGLSTSHEPAAPSGEAAARPGEPREGAAFSLKARDPAAPGGDASSLPGPQTVTSLNAATDASQLARAGMGMMQLTISARPETAILYLDGISLSDNPFNARVRADHQLHTIRASGIGLVTQERMITFDRDHAVNLDLGVPRPMRAFAQRSARQKPALNPSGAAGAPAGTSNYDSRYQRNLEPSATNTRTRASDLYDAPLRVLRTPRPIYEEDPYPQ